MTKNTPPPLPEDVREAVEYLKPLFAEWLSEFGDDDNPYKTEYMIKTLIAAASAPVWRTMESAPRDGTRILVYHVPSRTACVAYVNEHGEFRHVDGAEIYEPTYWQKLPSPPATSEG